MLAGFHSMLIFIFQNPDCQTIPFHTGYWELNQWNITYIINRFIEDLTVRVRVESLMLLLKGGGKEVLCISGKRKESIREKTKIKYIS